MDSGNGKSRDSGFAKPLPTGWFKRFLTQQSQVDQTNTPEIRELAGQAGIRSEASACRLCCLE